MSERRTRKIVQVAVYPAALVYALAMTLALVLAAPALAWSFAMGWSFRIVPDAYQRALNPKGGAE